MTSINDKERQDHEASLKLDWNKEHGGQIHLDGEMDFPKDTPLKEVYETLHERAMEIGGLVTKKSNTKIKVSCQYGELIYILEAEAPTQPVNKITSINKTENTEVTRTIEELEEIGEIAQKFKKALEEGGAEWTIEKDNERKNIMEM